MKSHYHSLNRTVLNTQIAGDLCIISQQKYKDAYTTILPAVHKCMCTGQATVFRIMNGELSKNPVPGKIPNPLSKPYTYTTQEPCFTTSDSVIEFIKKNNPFIKFVQRYINLFTNDYDTLLCVSKDLKNMVLNLHKTDLSTSKYNSLPGTCWIVIADYIGPLQPPIQHEIRSPAFLHGHPDGTLYRANLKNITMKGRPPSFSRAALYLDCLMPLILSEANVKDSIPRTIELLTECESLQRSNRHYEDFLVRSLIKKTKPEELGWVEFLQPYKSIDYLKDLCAYFEIEYSDNVVILFNPHGFEKLISRFSQTTDFYPIRADIPTTFKHIIGLQKDGDVQWMVKFGPESFTKGKKQTWKQELHKLPPDLKQRLGITGEVLVISAGNRAEISKTWDEEFGTQYTLETLPDKFTKAMVRVNPNGELEIKADVPQATPAEPAPAADAQQNPAAVQANPAPALVVARSIPSITVDEIHALTIPLRQLGELKVTGDNSVKEKSGATVDDLSKFIKGKSISTGFKACSLQLSIENMRALLVALQTCKQKGHFYYADLPMNAIKGDHFFVGKDTQGLYAGCIRKGKIYSSQ